MDVLQPPDYFLPFKAHQRVLNGSKTTFECKVQSIIKVWDEIDNGDVLDRPINKTAEILEWAKLQTLNIVLQAEWNDYDPNYGGRLTSSIAKAQIQLSKVCSGFVCPCEKLLVVINDPWKNPVLSKILECADCEITDEVSEFFRLETAYLICVRLKKLCECQCEDLALNLGGAFLETLDVARASGRTIRVTEPQYWFIFDVRIALLYKFEKRQALLTSLKKLTYDEGLDLLKRFANKKPKLMELWKAHRHIAAKTAQIYITRIIFAGADVFLCNFVEEYLKVSRSDGGLEGFSKFIGHIGTLAYSPALYVICQLLMKNCRIELRSLITELYVRAITVDINELERHKDARESGMADTVTANLAAAYSQLTELFAENVKVARECVLTAFCLEPTKQRFAAIEDMARRSGFTVEQDTWKCRLHPPVLPTDEIMWLCSECGDWMCKPQLDVPVERNVDLKETLQHTDLGIPEELCDDLLVCLSYSRYLVLSWFLPWQELHRLCAMYLQNPALTKNFITDLKYLEIDYSMFKEIKSEPPDNPEENCDSLLNGPLLSGPKEAPVKETKPPTSKLKQLLRKTKPAHVTADSHDGENLRAAEVERGKSVLKKTDKSDCSGKKAGSPARLTRSTALRSSENLEGMRLKLMVKLCRNSSM